jgi:hypothetical protein
MGHIVPPPRNQRSTGGPTKWSLWGVLFVLTVSPCTFEQSVWWDDVTTCVLLPWLCLCHKKDPFFLPVIRHHTCPERRQRVHLLHIQSHRHNDERVSLSARGYRMSQRMGVSLRRCVFGRDYYPSGQGDLTYHIQIRYNGDISTTWESAQAGTNNDRGVKKQSRPTVETRKVVGRDRYNERDRSRDLSVMHTCCFLMLQTLESSRPCQYQLFFPPLKYHIRTCHSLSVSCTRNIQLTYSKIPPLPKKIRVPCVYVFVYVYIYICI